MRAAISSTRPGELHVRPDRTPPARPGPAHRRRSPGAGGTESRGGPSEDRLRDQIAEGDVRRTGNRPAAASDGFARQLDESHVGQGGRNHSADGSDERQRRSAPGMKRAAGRLASTTSLAARAKRTPSRFVDGELERVREMLVACASDVRPDERQPGADRSSSEFSMIQRTIRIVSVTNCLSLGDDAAVGANAGHEFDGLSLTHGNAGNQGGAGRVVAPASCIPRISGVPLPGGRQRTSSAPRLEQFFHGASGLKTRDRAMTAISSVILIALAAVILMVAARRLLYQARADRAARAETEGQLRYSDQLQQLTAILSRARTPDDVVRACLPELPARRRGGAGGVTLVSDDGLTCDLVHAVGYDPAVVLRGRSRASSSNSVIAEAIRHRDLRGRRTARETGRRIARRSADSSSPATQARSSCRSSRPGGRSAPSR